MSTNLLDLAKSALGSGAWSRVANSLGESEEQTKSAFDIAVSAILGGLIKKMSNTQGAKDVYEEVNRFDTSTFDNIADVITGGASQENATAFTSLGSRLVSSLLGSNQDSIIATIARLAGIDQSSSKSLLTMIAPLLLGTIAKQVKSSGLSLGGLTDLIMGQKPVVSKNLPSAITQQLGIANLLDQGGKAVRAGAERASRTTAEAASAGSGALKILVPLAILAALGFVIWKMASPDVARNQVAEKKMESSEPDVPVTQESGPVTADDAGQAADRVTLNKPAIPGVDLAAISEELQTKFGSITKSIADITDEATAKEAVPQIEEFTGALKKYDFEKMPQETISGLHDTLQPLIDKLQAAIDTASKIPGVKEILEPAVSALMKSVSTLTTAS